MSKSALIKNKKELFLKLYIAIVFSVFTVFPLYYNATEDTRLLLGLVSLVIWYLIADFALKAMGLIRKLFASMHTNKLDTFILNTKDIVFFLGCWICLILIWIPAYCTLYPGILGYDAPIQLRMWQGALELTSHHPLTHTALIGLLYDFGTKVLGGSSNTGVAVYTTVQGLIVTGSISYTLLALRRCGVRTIGLILSFVWLAFNPFLQVLTFNSTKDILFGAFLSVFLAVFMQCLWKEQWNKKTAAALMVFGILTCLFRHQGIYFFAALLLFILIAPRPLKKLKKPLVIVMVVVVVFFEGFSFICNNVLKIEAGDSREMLSVPMQQMAHVCLMKLDGVDVNVSDEQLAQVETFLPEGGIRGYESNTADYVKACFDTEAFTADLGKNVLTYIELGLQNPQHYSYAFRSLSEGYIDSDEMEYTGLMFMYTFQDALNIDVYRSPIMFDDYYDILVNNTFSLGYERAPLLSVLYKPSYCVWLLAALIGVVFYRRDYKLWLLILPILLLCVSLFLGPVSLVRYLYPILLLVPLMIICIVKPAP